MHSGLVWLYTCTAFALILAFDLSLAWKGRNEITSSKKSTIATLAYVFSAIFFGVMMSYWVGGAAQKEFFASWLTEYSLSIDNIFVFLLVFNKLQIRRQSQELILFFGISLSLILRGIFLLLGISLVHTFKFTYFIFALLLAYTGVQVIKDDGDPDWQEGSFITFLRNRRLGSMKLALVAIAVTDLLFALDSIPAVIGITTNFYVIVCANFFALMGLRQLYFVVEKLIAHLELLSAGLGVILIFISIKLSSEALAEYKIRTIAGWKIPLISTQDSLLFIVVTLTFATFLSLLRRRRPHYPF